MTDLSFSIYIINMTSPEQKFSNKSRRIVIRVKLPMYDFLDEFARNTGRTLSDVVRNACDDYYMRLWLGNLNPSTKELKRMFIEAYGDKKTRMINLRKRNIKL